MLLGDRYSQSIKVEPDSDVDLCNCSGWWPNLVDSLAVEIFDVFGRWWILHGSLEVGGGPLGFMAPWTSSAEIQAVCVPVIVYKMTRYNCSGQYNRSEYPGIRKSGYPEIRKSGFPSIRISGNLDFRKSGFQEIRILGFPDIRISGFLDILISGYFQI